MDGIYRSPGDGINIIYSDNWSVIDKAIDIKFDISPVIMNNKEGVYTVVVFLKDHNATGTRESFPVTTYSVHYIKSYNSKMSLSSI